MPWSSRVNMVDNMGICLPLTCPSKHGICHCIANSHWKWPYWKRVDGLVLPSVNDPGPKILPFPLPHLKGVFLCMSEMPSKKRRFSSLHFALAIKKPRFYGKWRNGFHDEAEEDAKQDRPASLLLSSREAFWGSHRIPFVLMGFLKGWSKAKGCSLLCLG